MDISTLNAPDVQQIFLQRLGMRLGPEMSAYVLRRLREGASSGMRLPDDSVPVMGGDARTGVPVYRLVPLSDLLPPLTSDP